MKMHKYLNYINILYFYFCNKYVHKKHNLTIHASDSSVNRHFNIQSVINSSLTNGICEMVRYMK